MILAVAFAGAGAALADAGPAAVPVPAGSVPDRLRVTLTGAPASASFVREQIEAALTKAVAPGLAASSTVRVTAILPQPEALGSGFLTTFTAAISIVPGPGMQPVNDQLPVDVVNVRAPAFRPARLALADDPEGIVADGVLSRTTVAAGEPSRLYYYHENRGLRRRFCVILTANDSVLSHVQIIRAAGGPNLDVMSVGHAVSKIFVSRKPHGEGSVITIAGGKPVIERDAIAGPGDGIVGALDLRVLDGGPVTVTEMAIPPAAEPPAYLYGSKLPGDGHQRRGNFDLADFGQRIVAYTAGGRDATYVYGTRARTLANTDPADPGRDYGDYGVLHRVTFDLANPAPVPATLYLYERPLGGVVRSSFLVNGKLIDVGCVRVPQRYLIAPLGLAAGATGTFDVLTMTDGGSNYPLELGVTSTPPLTSAPPIAAADGCFPKPGGPPAAAQPENRLPGQ